MTRKHGVRGDILSASLVPNTMRSHLHLLPATVLPETVSTVLSVPQWLTLQPSACCVQLRRAHPALSKPQVHRSNLP